MKGPPSESAIVVAVAEAAARRISGETIGALQQMTQTMSGDDSGLTNLWEEICVQVQDEHSFFWDAYDDIARDLVEGFASKIPEYEKQALWLQTPPGEDWQFSEPEDRDPNPIIDLDEIVEYVLTHHVYSQAADWSNARIEAYKESFEPGEVTPTRLRLANPDSPIDIIAMVSSCHRRSNDKCPYVVA
jgi:hypothetical protein